MRLTDLKTGDVFQLEGAHYETIAVWGRIVYCYVLAPTGFDKPMRIPDPEDLTGDAFLTTMFSDMRFEREHLTDEERRYDAEVNDLL